MSKTAQQPLTEAEERELRELVDQFAVVASSQKTSKKHHIPHGDSAACIQKYNGGKLCSFDDEDVKHKDIELFPLGWRPFCGYCSAYFREEMKDGKE